MSLPWRSAGSVGNSRNSTQMNSYSDSGYQDVVSFYSSQAQGECQQRLQNSLPASGESSRAEGHAAGHHRTLELQVSGMMDRAKPGCAMRRVGSMPARAQSLYGSSVSPSRGSLRATGSSYGLPITTVSKPVSSVFTSTTLSAVPQKTSPAALRRMGSSRSSGARHTTSHYSGGVGSAREDEKLGAVSPARPGMMAVPQYYGSMMSRTFLHDVSNPYITHSYEIYERIDPRPDSLTGKKTVNVMFNIPFLLLYTTLCEPS